MRLVWHSFHQSRTCQKTALAKKYIYLSDKELNAAGGGKIK